MNDENFNMIISGLSDRIQNCQDHLMYITRKEDLLQISVGELLELKNFAIAEVSQMDRIIEVDYYHLTGMGELLTYQQLKIDDLMKQYLSFRPLIKTLAFNINDITKIPEMPGSGAYKVSFCDVTLGTLISEIKSEGAISSMVEENSMSFDLKGDRIYVSDQNLEEFYNECQDIVKNICNFDKFKDSITHLRPILGIQWNTYDNGMYSGKIVNTGTIASYTKHVQKHKGGK